MKIRNLTKKCVSNIKVKRRQPIVLLIEIFNVNTIKAKSTTNTLYILDVVDIISFLDISNITITF